MARIEKTVFISYRRADVYTALAVYENLRNQGYDVFFDYRSISSGDFEQIITSNIKARAHFVLILTPTALDRCNEPGDWLCREIETAIDEKRNIIPLLFKRFQFATPSVSEKLTGKLKSLSSYNGLNVHEDYFDEAMVRLRTQYLKVPLDTVLHPVSTLVRNAVKEEQVAVDEALRKNEEVKELVKQAKKSPNKPKDKPILAEHESTVSINNKPDEKRFISSINPRLIGGIVGGLVVFALLIWGGVRVFNNTSTAASKSTQTLQSIVSPTLLPSGFQNTSAPTQTLMPKATDTSLPTQSSIPETLTPGIDSTITGKDGMTMLYVPAGEFTMGSDKGDGDEQPVHKVTLDAFWIDQTEVTNAMYANCVDSGECNPPGVTRSYTRQKYFGFSDFDKYPVIYVTWSDARTYCQWANRRLLTEAEWEKAARGQDGGDYPWGNNGPTTNLLNYDGSIGDTTTVGSYESGKSPYGVYDMAGNVWEWVSSLYEPYPYSPTDGREDLSANGNRVLRGGSWSMNDYYVRSSFRFGGDPAETGDFYGVGFRCAMSATP